MAGTTTIEWQGAVEVPAAVRRWTTTRTTVAPRTDWGVVGALAQPVASSINPAQVGVVTGLLIRLASEKGYVGRWADAWSGMPVTDYGHIFGAPVLAYQASLSVTVRDENASDEAVHYEEFALDMGDFLVYIDRKYSSYEVTVYGNSPGAALNFIRLARSKVPPIPSPPESAELTFHYMTSNGPASFTERLAVPAWSLNCRNYPRKTRTSLDSLYTLQPFTVGAAGGKLLLFHGVPGTGKTYAIRSLAWEWREWCSIRYVVDPEILLGNSQYLMSILQGTRTASKKWTLLVLEDSGELMAADAKSRTGQEISRLFNVTDGLLGQVHNVMVLITTNEALGSLHPAVVRPGRCLANIEFSKFSQVEQLEWLGIGSTRAPTLPPKSERTLAEMYALIEQGSRILNQPERREVGFAK